MKVGTDAVLLGAWCATDNIQRVLDIGTGSGIISLMVAQRSQATIHSVEIDHQAYLQAKTNFEQSEWSDRMSVYHADFSEFSEIASSKYDLIVSNPPYFTNGVQAPCKKRSTARHADSLNYQQLFKGVVQLLSNNGRFALILPADAESEIETIASGCGLHQIRKCNVYPKTDGVIKRIMWEFSKTGAQCSEEHLVIELDRHVYSEDYKALTKEFYLKM
ncbi:MAG: tRNA1(Val) (adenine(37)-N6)-methyltransferase [Bacteroidales bacterium]